MKLTKMERGIEKALLKGEYVNVPESEFKRIAAIVAHHRKDAVLSLRINRRDLDNLKKKANQYNVPYQSFISEILHRYAA
jgi:predicted DNA binding CopG/RHH family protein